MQQNILHFLWFQFHFDHSNIFNKTFSRFFGFILTLNHLIYSDFFFHFLWFQFDINHSNIFRKTFSFLWFQFDFDPANIFSKMFQFDFDHFSIFSKTVVLSFEFYLLFSITWWSLWYSANFPVPFFKISSRSHESIQLNLFILFFKFYFCFSQGYSLKFIKFISFHRERSSNQHHHIFLVDDAERNVCPTLTLGFCCRDYNRIIW